MTLFEYYQRRDAMDSTRDARSPQPSVGTRIKDPPGELPDNTRNNPKGKNLRQATEDWIDRNPEIYALYKKFATDLLLQGKPFSIKLITERVRWECHLHWSGEFKISNDYPAYIARKMAEEMPELRNVLKFKKTRW